MNIFKVSTFKITSSVFDNTTFYTKYGIKTNPDAVVLKNEEKQQLSLNNGTYKANFQFDGTIFKSIKEKVDDDNYVTYPKQISSPGAFVVHEDDFDQTDVLKDLIGMSIKEEDDNYVELEVKTDSDKVTVSFLSPEQFDVVVTDSSIQIDGGDDVDDNFEFTKGKVTIKGLISNSDIYSKLTESKVIADLQDSDDNEYYYEYDVANNVFAKKKLEITDDYVFSDYGAVLNKLKDIGIGASMEEIYDIDNEKYFDSDQMKIINIRDSVIRELNTSRILSLLTQEDDDGVVLYDYGYFKSTDLMYPGYVYYGSSYIYISYYRSKVEHDDCTYSDDTGTETALKLKIKKNKEIEIKTDNTAKTILTHSDADFSNDFIKVLKRGVGVFHNHLFDIKKYKDEGDKITVVYNYDDSDNNYTMEIDDQTTRYVCEDTRKVDGDDSTETKRYYRYKTYPILEFSNTKSKLNMFKKKWIDYVADPTDSGLIYAGSITVPAYQVLEKNKMLILNPYNTDVDFDKEKVSIDTLARIAMIQDDELKIINIIYQPSTGAVFTKIGDDIVKASDYVDLFNDNSDYFKAKVTCDYARINFKNLDNEDRVLEFPISTYFIAEPLNGVNGMFYRVYYKNAKDIGYIDAIKYTITD